MSKELTKMFDSEECNALAEAFVLSSEATDFKDEEGKIYDYLQEEPKTSLVVFLVQNLHQLGYKIVKS